MEAKELRIGNLIYQNGEITRVESLSRSIDDWDRTNHKRTMDCEPIELTEEWLEKFGFNIKNKYRLDWFKGAFNLERSDEYDSKFFFEVYSHYIPLNYVHQLQNLYFALTGEDLIYNKD